MRVRRGSYDELPKSIQQMIDAALAENIPEPAILEMVQAEGYALSRSALNRYKINRWRPEAERLQLIRDRARVIVETIKAAPSRENLDAIQGLLEAGLLVDLENEEALAPEARARILLKLDELRMKKEKLHLDRLKQELETQRLELDKMRVQIQHRLKLLPGAIETWKLILKFFADHDPVILSQLQAHSESIAKLLEAYFEGRSTTEDAEDAEKKKK